MVSVLLGSLAAEAANNTQVGGGGGLSGIIANLYLGFHLIAFYESTTYENGQSTDLLCYVGKGKLSTDN